MATQLSFQQRRIFFRLWEILSSGDVIVSKKRLKYFFCWLSVEVSDFNLQNIESITFWDKIGELFTLKAEKGDEAASLFILVFLQIRKQLLKAEHSRQQKEQSISTFPPRRQRQDTPDPSPPRTQRRDTPDVSPPRQRQRHDTPDPSPPHRQRHDSLELPPARWHPDLSPQREKPGSPRGKSQRKGWTSSTQQEQHRPQGPPGSPKKANTMSSRAKAGLVPADVLQRDKQELQTHGRSTKHLEEESWNAQTVFRDKSGCKRNLAQEQLEQRLKAEAKREEQYGRWGKGLAQERQQQNIEDAVKEMQKPLARYIDDQDLDRMLRKQEREGDPMAALIKKRKAKESKETEKPRYKGPAPPLNRFNIWPGHRWDGVDRSSGFEQQRFARIASKKGVQQLTCKYSTVDTHGLGTHGVVDFHS